MKIKIKTEDGNYWYYHGINELYYLQKEFDYMFKYLDFDKIDKKCYIHFNNKEEEEWFRKMYINNTWLKHICNNSPDGYGYLKNNWGKSIFKLILFYLDKQEIKIIINKLVNIELKIKVRYHEN